MTEETSYCRLQYIKPTLVSISLQSPDREIKQ